MKEQPQLKIGIKHSLAMTQSGTSKYKLIGVWLQGCLRSFDHRCAKVSFRGQIIFLNQNSVGLYNLFNMSKIHVQNSFEFCINHYYYMKFAYKVAGIVPIWLLVDKRPWVWLMSTQTLSHSVRVIWNRLGVVEHRLAPNAWHIQTLPMSITQIFPQPDPYTHRSLSSHLYIAQRTTACR